MSDVSDDPSALRWPAPQFVPAPGGAPPAFTLALIDVPELLDRDATLWLPELVARARLHPDEAALAGEMPHARRATFVAGRLALRAALTQHAPHEAPSPILRTNRGAPVLPRTVSGSLSHKHDAALALMSPRSRADSALINHADIHHVGVDLEHRPTARDVSRPSIARRVLTAEELDALQHFSDDALQQRERVILSFAIKEAIYKSIDPVVQRSVRFTEVALHFAPSGGVHVTLLLPELLHGELRVHAHYSVDDRWIVATAIATSAAW